MQSSVADNRQPSRVLLIDDAPAMHAAIEAALQGIAEMRAVDNGETGVQVAEQWQPDLIICDMLMPGINGFETIVRIKMIEEARTVPIILISGAGEELQSFPGLKDLVACVLPKPFELGQLRSRVKELLHHPRTISSEAPADPPE
jgi:PleD family two-component response regulator